MHDTAVNNHADLGRTHTKRLRELFAYGRAVSLSELGAAELVLIARGLLARVPSHSSCAMVEVTDAGVQYLAGVHEARVETLQKHESLAERLAAHLRGQGMRTWLNVALDNPHPVWHEQRWGYVRPDVYACFPTRRAAKCKPVIYEVKVSRSDFTAELAKPDKLGAYRELAEAVYFCCPDGLVDRRELPRGIGLVVERDDGRFEIQARAARSRDFQPHPDTLMTLLMRQEREALSKDEGEAHGSSATVERQEMVNSVSH